MSNECVNPDAKAKRDGLVINEPYDNELQLDIDSSRLPEDFDIRMGILGQIIPVVEVRYTTSKSGNLHAYVELGSAISPTERILLQACLGSDPLRELLTFRNTRNPENKRPQFLFELKDAIKRSNP